MKHRRFVLLLVTACLGMLAVRTPLLVKPVIPAGRLAGISGQGSTQLHLVNLDAQSAAHGRITFSSYAEGAQLQLDLPGLEPGHSGLVDPLAIQGLADGPHAALVQADRRVGVVSVAQWPNGGGYAAATQSAPSTDVLVPLTEKEHEGVTSLLAIQNTSLTRDADVEAAFYDFSASSPARRVQFTLPPGGARILDLARTPELRQLPQGYVGSARVRSPLPIAVQVLGDLGTSRTSVYAFEGVPLEAAGEELLLPLVQAAMPSPDGEGGLYLHDSVIAVLNAGTGPVVVTVSYQGYAGSCAGQRYVANPVTIPGGRSVVYFQGDAGTGQPTGRSPLPDGCVAAAKLTAAYGRIAAAVIDRTRDPAGRVVALGAYQAFGPAQAAKRLWTPIFGKRQRHTSAIVAMNAGSQTTQASVSFRSASGAAVDCEACRTSIRPGAGFIWWPPAIAGLADREWGPAEISADQPLAVLVADWPAVGAQTGPEADAAIFNALPLGQTAGATLAAAPLVMKRAVIVPPTPEPTITPTGTVPPAPEEARAEVWVQNLDRHHTAGWQLELTAYESGQRTVIAGPTLAPGARAHIKLWEATELQRDHYSAVLSADRPVGALTRINWPGSGRSVVYPWPEVSSELVIPWVVKRYNGQTSQLAVQNTSRDAETTVQLAFHDYRQTQPVLTSSFVLAPRRARLLDLAKNPMFSALPNNSLGFLYLRAQARLAVAALVGWDNAPGLGASIVGMPVERLADRLYLPWFRREFRDGTTAVTVVNLGSSEVQAGITYYGGVGACAGQRYSGRPMAIPPGGSAFMNQAPSPNHNLPADCAGSAVVTAAGGLIAAVVDDRVRHPVLGTLSVAMHPAVDQSRGSSALAAPFVRRHAQSGVSLAGLQAMNLGSSTTVARLTFYDSQGEALPHCGPPCEITIGAREGHLWWLDEIPGLPPGFEGHVWIEADQPLAVLIFEQPVVPPAVAVEDGTAYLAFPVPADLAAQPSERFVLYGPYLPHPSGALPTPTATVAPIMTQTATATEAASGRQLFLPQLGRDWATP